MVNFSIQLTQDILQGEKQEKSLEQTFLQNTTLWKEASCSVPLTSCIAYEAKQWKVGEHAFFPP